MYCSDQQIHLIHFFSLFNAKTGYGRLDSAKSLDDSLWSLSRSRSPKIWTVSERSIFNWSRSGVRVKNFRLCTPLALAIRSLEKKANGPQVQNHYVKPKPETFW